MSRKIITEKKIDLIESIVKEIEKKARKEGIELLSSLSDEKLDYLLKKGYITGDYRPYALLTGQNMKLYHFETTALKGKVKVKLSVWGLKGSLIADVLED